MYLEGTEVSTVFKNRLIKLLYDNSFKISDKPEFKLTSGKMSKVYVNCKNVTYSVEGMRLIGTLMWDMISNCKDVNLIGGIATGSIPISMAISFSSPAYKNIGVFVVRKCEKDHGIDCKIDGPIEKGKNVVIVEDVITTGGSTIDAINIAKKEGLNVVKVVTLVDREEGGLENIKHIYCEDIESVIKLSDLTNYHMNQIRSNLIS